MTNVRDLFIDMVSHIIHQELDDIQQTQYSIEGEEIIASLFASNQFPEYFEEDELIFDFGIAPTALDIKAAGITFIDIIKSCFSLLKLYPEEAPVEESTTIYLWKEALANEKTNPVLSNLLCEKYHTLLSE